MKKLQKFVTVLVLFAVVLLPAQSAFASTLQVIVNGRRVMIPVQNSVQHSVIRWNWSAPVHNPVRAPKPAPRPAPAPAPAPAPVNPVQQYQLNAAEQEMIRLINEERRKAGAAPLIIDLELSRVARIKSQDMRDSNYFSHTSPTYGSPFDMMRSFGIRYRTAGENIARHNSVQSAHTGLMNSDGHRRNILNPNFTHIGVGIVDNRYYTQLFVGR